MPRRCAASENPNIDALPSGNQASVVNEHGDSSILNSKVRSVSSAWLTITLIGVT